MANRKLIRFDWAIKYILRNKSNFDVLEAFLSNLLKEEIKVLDILESESNRDDETKKFNRVDMKCKDSKGRIIIVEIQNQREVDYLQRVLWGSSKAVVETMNTGDKYINVAKVISINILYHKMREDEQKNTDFIYYGTTELFGVHTKKPLVLHDPSPQQDELPFVTSKNIFPEYYMIYVEKFQDMINEDIDEWIYFFKHAEIKDTFKSPGIRLLSSKLDYLMMDSKEKRSYDKYLEYLSYEIGVLDNAIFQGRDEGIVIGREEGVVIGREEGIVIGREEGIGLGIEKGIVVGREEGIVVGREEGIEIGIFAGREEGLQDAMILVATKMLKSNDSIEKIQMLTGLSFEKIKELAKNINL